MPLTLADKFYNLATVSPEHVQEVYTPHIIASYHSSAFSLTIFTDNSSIIVEAATSFSSSYDDMPTFLQVLAKDTWTQAALTSIIPSSPNLAIALQATHDTLQASTTLHGSSDEVTAILSALTTILPNSKTSLLKETPSNALH